MTSATREQDEVSLNAEDLALVADLQKPGIKDSTILTLDSVLTLMQIFKAEVALALGSLPALIGLNLTRAPVYLLTWLSFAIFVACSVYALFESVVAGAGAFFVLHLCVVGVLEWKIHRMHERIDFPESRKGLAVLKESLKERLKREHAP
jgi:hypothetical protein